MKNRISAQVSTKGMISEEAIQKAVEAMRKKTSNDIHKILTAGYVQIQMPQSGFQGDAYWCKDNQNTTVTKCHSRHTSLRCHGCGKFFVGQAHWGTEKCPRCGATG